LKLRTRAQQLFRLSDDHTMLIWAVIVGVAGALATVAFREGIAGLQRLLTGDSGDLIEIARRLPWYLRLTLPAGGGLLAGVCLVMAKRVASASGGAKNLDYMEAATIGDGHIPLRQTLWRSGSSLLTIASGSSIGREGPMVQLAALSASLIGRFMHFDPHRLRLLVACGAAAGITSAYNAPIAGALFITEIVLGSLAMESFGPVMVSSVVANIVMREFAGYAPPYQMPVFPAISGAAVIWFVVLGALCGAAAPWFLRLLAATRKGFAVVGPLPLRLALGGLLVGAMSVGVPEVWGNGYGVVNSILHQPWTWQALILVLVFKIAATGAAFGSGAVGGTFTPTLFVGAVLGALFGHLVHGAFGTQAVAPFAYAIVGMGAFLAASTNAPLMAILMIFEMTLSYQVVLPLMLSSVVAYFIARAIGETSMYEITLRRDAHTRARTRLQATQMRELVKPADTVLPLTATVQDMTRVFLEYPVKYLYVVDEHGSFQGVVALKDITSDLLDHSDTSSKCAADYIRSDVGALTPDMPLGAALQHFMAFQGERLPVVETTPQRRLVGVVYKTSLLDAYFRMNAAA
jgi:CIC family chloride channel protein